MAQRKGIAYRVMIDSESLHARVRELAEAVSKEYAHTEPVLICNLKGAFVFLADLCRHLAVLHEVDFIATSSYKGGTSSSGEVRIIKDIKASIANRHVLVVEDIIDTGLTLDYVLHYLSLHNPASLKVVALLDKKERRQIDIEADYVGFSIPDKFTIGYGLDFMEKYRHLDCIAEYIPGAGEG